MASSFFCPPSLLFSSCSTLAACRSCDTCASGHSNSSSDLPLLISLLQPGFEWRLASSARLACSFPPVLLWPLAGVATPAHLVPELTASAGPNLWHRSVPGG